MAHLQQLSEEQGNTGVMMEKNEFLANRILELEAQVAYLPRTPLADPPPSPLLLLL